MIQSPVAAIPMLAVLAVLSGAAQAAQPADKPTFQSLDKNSDGKVSVNEAADHDRLFVAFQKLDSNKDGNLTREEFAAFER